MSETTDKSRNKCGGRNRFILCFAKRKHIFAIIFAAMCIIAYWPLLLKRWSQYKKVLKTIDLNKFDAILHVISFRFPFFK